MTGNLKHIILILILFITSFSLSASNAKFYSLNAKFGISIRETNTICKDHVGFIWASSKTGILRITEDDYRLYQLPYTNANVISVSLVYHQGTLLAYTNNGQIFTYNQLTDKFELLVNLELELKRNYFTINSVLIENSRAIWISSSSGLFRYDSGEISLIKELNKVVLNLIRYTNDEIIYGTNDGLYIIDIKTFEKTDLFVKKAGELFNPSVMYYDALNEIIWVGTLANGLLKIDTKTKMFQHVYQQKLPKQPVLAIERISDSTLLVGIDGQGLWEIDQKREHVYSAYKEDIDNSYSLKGNGVYDIYCDDDKRVWVSTYSGGISYFDQTSSIVTQITHLPNNSNSLNNNDVNCVIEDSHHNLWFATNNGISHWNISENKWSSFYVNEQEQAQVFLTLCEDDQGRVWAGTYASGVYVLNGKTGKQLAHYSQSVFNSPFVNEFVFDIVKDSLSNIWIGGINSPVIRYDSNNQSFKKYSTQPIYVLTELNKDQMLFGCTYGLCRSDNNTGETNVLLYGSLIHDILVMDSIVWLGSSGDGLIRFNPLTGERQFFNTDNGLPSNFVNSVAFSSGYLWIGTENGLCRFDPEKKCAHVYSSIPLLLNTSFNRNAHYELANGQMIWGTNNGALMFNPMTIEQVYDKGEIFLQDINILGRSIRERSDFNIEKPLNEYDKIILKHNQNNISIELLPIGVASGSKFSWMLEGLDEVWTQPASHRVLSYSNIPSKQYKLKIKLYDNSLSNVLAERTLLIKVTPPFWATSWFLMVAFVIITSIIFFVFWYYINLLKQRHTEEKVRFFANTAHDLRTSLTLIKAPIEELSKENNLSATGQYNINLANEQALRLSTVVTQLMDFQKVDVGKGQLVLMMVNIVSMVKRRVQMFDSLAVSKQVAFQFECNRKEYWSAIDETQIEKVLDNLISNAVKYSKANSIIEVDLNLQDDKWEFKITDQGIGIDKRDQKQLFKEFYRAENAVNSKIVGSGIGLLLVKNYVHLHGGFVDFSSQLNSGSTFMCSIPHKTVEAVSHSTSDVKIPDALQNVAVVSLTDDEKDEPTGMKTQMKILLVEDNEDLLSFMQTNLEGEFVVFTSSDGEEAWQLIQKEQPDLVISDVMMPKMDGFELCQQMKSSFETSHIPIVLLTALAGKAEQLHGLGLGADDYLTKPFDMALLRQKIKSIISNRMNVRNKTLNLIKENVSKLDLNNDLNNEFLNRMMETVRENISNASFNKDEFASSMNVSPSLLYKKVKSFTDQSPTEFIKTVRMNYAYELLILRKYNVTEVSEMSGFSSIGYFSTVFKKHFGKSPTEV